MTKTSSSCSEEDETAIRCRANEQSDLSKADFLGWIAAKCQLLRKSPKTFFEFKALETFSELAASLLVKAFESAVKCEETLTRSIIDDMWSKLEEQHQTKKDQRTIQDVIIIWPFVKEFAMEIIAWKERQEQAKKNFFIRRAFDETKNASPPLLVTVSSAELLEDEPKSLMSMRKRRLAETQPTNSPYRLMGPIGGCSPLLPSWASKKREREQSARKDENEGGDDETKKRRTETETAASERAKGEAEKQRWKNPTGMKQIKQEVIEVDDDEPNDETVPIIGMQKKEMSQKPAPSNGPSLEVPTKPAPSNRPSLEVPTKPASSNGPSLGVPTTPAQTESGDQRGQTDAQKGAEAEEDDDDMYTLSFGDKSLFGNEEDSDEPETADKNLQEVKREPAEDNVSQNDEAGQLVKTPNENELTESEENGATAREEEGARGEEGDQTEGGADEYEEDDASTSGDGTDTPPPLPGNCEVDDNAVVEKNSNKKGANKSGTNGNKGKQAHQGNNIKMRPYSPNGGSPHPTVETQFAAVSSSLAHIDGFEHKVIKVSPQKRSEFDIFDRPISPPPRPASPAKNEQRKYSGKVKIRKRLEYEAEQKLKRRLFVGEKVLRFSDKIWSQTFLIDEGNVISRPTANEKSPYIIASSTINFLKKSVKTNNKSGGQRHGHRRHMDAQVSTEVRDVVMAVEERCKELTKQQNSANDGDELAIARGDRLVRFSRLLLADSLLHRLDEQVLKNAYVLRSLEHPKDIGLFIEKGLNSNSSFLRNPSHLAYFEFSYLFVVYGHDQIVHCQSIPDPSDFLTWLRNWFLHYLPIDDQNRLMKIYEDEYHYHYTPPRFVAVTIPEVGQFATQFCTFNDRLRQFISADRNNEPFTLLDWAQMVAECSDGDVLESEEKRMQLLVKEMNNTFGVLIR